MCHGQLILLTEMFSVALELYRSFTWSLCLHTNCWTCVLWTNRQVRPMARCCTVARWSMVCWSKWKELLTHWSASSVPSRHCFQAQTRTWCTCMTSPTTTAFCQMPSTGSITASSTSRQVITTSSTLPPTGTSSSEDTFLVSCIICPHYCIVYRYH